MDPSIAYALGALAAAGVSDFVYKRAQGERVATGSYLMTQSAVYFICSNIVSHTAQDGAFSRADLFWGPIIGLLSFMAFKAYFQSLEAGDAGVNSTVFRLSFAITSALAILFLAESAGAMKVAGLVLAACAISLMSFGGLRSTRGPVFLALFAMMVLGINRFVFKLALLDGASPTMLPILQSAAFFSCITAYTYLKEGGYRPTRRILSHAPLNGVLLAASVILLLKSLEAGEASISVPIVNHSFFITALLGWAFLGERLDRRKSLGLALAVASIISLSSA